MDNDPHIHDRMKQALGGEFTVQCVGSVSEARRCLSLSQPDIVISEVVIGRESGLDLCRYVRSNPSLQQLPIMLLTSMATLQDKVEGFQAGTDDYVVKPFDTHHLIARIRLLARIKRLERRTTV
ncbi:response regulator transcription factor [Dictyobacter formicarum]